ncbi:retrovirus-related pol polyprotein from transposon TNT 1-94 [Tanacetum coccineum]
MEDQRNKFAPYPLPPQDGNMNGWLINDANDLDLESTASNQPMSLTMGAIENTTRPPLKSSLKNGLGFVKTESRCLELLHIDLFGPSAIQSYGGTKWMFRNKLNENGIISRNKARLVAQGYNQQEGIYYDETYASVVRLESIRILLALACANDFKLYQMDVKSAFLNGFINEEDYIAQPLGFIDFENPNCVNKLKKALYSPKQAPKAWYDRLKAFVLKHEYSIKMVDNTLFTKIMKTHLIIVQIYVEYIIFGSTCQELCDDFAKIMHDEFEMSMMGELNFFLGLQIKQMEDGVFFNQSKYTNEMLKKFGI